MNELPHSPYLSPEAVAAREEALVRRVVAEHCGAGPYTFDESSDYGRLPERLRRRVVELLHIEEPGESDWTGSLTGLEN